MKTRNDYAAKITNFCTTLSKTGLKSKRNKKKSRIQFVPRYRFLARFLAKEQLEETVVFTN